jgi:hypothetical protein
MGPVGVVPTPVTEGVVFSIHRGCLEWGILSNDQADGMFCPDTVKKLFDR